MVRIENLPTKAHGKRKWFQFRLRTLLVLTALVACTAGTLGVRFKQARDQRIAVTELLKLGATITYEDGNRVQQNVPLGRLSQIAPTAKSTWMRTLLGDDFFSRVTQLDLRESNYFGWSTRKLIAKDPIDDGSLAHVANLPYLRVLVLSSDKVTDDGLQVLKGLSELEELEISRARITDDGVKFLGPLRALKKLHLVDAPLTDSVLNQITSYWRLEELDLSGSQITDDGLPLLHDMTSLRVLTCRNTRVTREGMNRLRDALPRTWTAY